MNNVKEIAISVLSHFGFRHSKRDIFAPDREVTNDKILLCIYYTVKKFVNVHKCNFMKYIIVIVGREEGGGYGVVVNESVDKIVQARIQLDMDILL